MATQYYDFVGKAYWAKVYTPDTFAGDRRWSIDLYLEDKELEKYKKAGLSLEPIKKPATDSGTGYKFRRPVAKVIKGKAVEFEPPVVQVWKDGERVPFTEVIGNGSTVKINVAVYETGRMGKGHRLQSVTVLDHVKYEAPEQDKSEATKKSW